MVNGLKFLPILVCKNSTGNPCKTTIINMITTTKGKTNSIEIAVINMSKNLINA